MKKIRKAILIIHGFAGGTYDQEILNHELELKWNYDVFTFTLPGHEGMTDRSIKYTEWIEKAEYEIANTCKAAYNPVGADVANYNLTGITPTYPLMNHAYNPAALESTPIGEALIVAPSEEDYEMEVTLTQKVPTNWNTPAALTEKTMTYPLTIKAPDGGGFKKNNSYQVNLTVYGFERIVVTTEIKPWDTGAPINVGQD